MSADDYYVIRNHPDGEWADAAVEYIHLLQDALNRADPYLYTHGWKEDDATVQRGCELRAILGIKGSGE